jgi:membrane-associated PAP2 superfamily phosphatase
MWKRVPSEIKWGIVVFILLNIPFFLFKLDIRLISVFYNPQDPYPWSLRARYPWNLLYYFGSYPASITAIISLILIVLSYFRPDFQKYRKTSLFLVTVLVLGPGLTVNAIFKDHYGRPRPRDIECFGGQQKYYYPLEPAFSAKGKSFPCGHCSMGFYFFALFFLFKRKRKWLSWLSFAIAVGYGIMIGIARMGQGGHFPSDVLWAGGMVYFITAFLYYRVFRLHQAMDVPEKKNAIRKVGKNQQYIALVVGILVGALILAGVLVATPISVQKTVDIPETIRTLSVKAAQGDVRISSSEKIKSDQIHFHTEGFGFPGCRLMIDSLQTREQVFSIRYFIHGFHTEEKTSVSVVSQNLDSLSWIVKSSHILLDSLIQIPRMYLSVREGFITIFPPVKLDSLHIFADTPNKKWYFKEFTQKDFIKILSGKVQTLIHDQWVEGIHPQGGRATVLRFPKKSRFVVYAGRTM